MPETKYQRLIRLLKEMFQLGDAAELDFGIYRIMHARKAEIEKFLDQELFQKHVKEALAGEAGGKRAEIEKEIAEVLQKLKDLQEEDPTKNKKYQELVAKRDAEPDHNALEDEVYGHLLTFFGRYYQEGDFISQRRYGENAYAIPYNGEEVKLYWANHDQYYIKSSEDLKHYGFLVGPEHSRKRVRFKLVAATTERDNNKEQAGKERWHIVSGSEPITEEAGELVIPFEYRFVIREELVERLAALKAAKSGKPKTGRLFGDVAEAGDPIAEAEKDLGKSATRDDCAALSAATVLASDSLPEAWRSHLRADYIGVDGEPTGRSVIEHHIRRYMDKAKFDYFIHKDLDGLLRRELDWYIKHELLHLQDILDSGNTLEQLGRRHFAKLRVLRRVAEKLIAFLTQLENFQKKLWLKKKFVLETRYLVRVGIIPEEFYAEIAANDAQREEWVKLYAIDEIKETTACSGYGKPLTPAFLKAQPTLVVDTKQFDQAFRARLLAALGDVDEQTDGTLLHGDNFQALGILQARYRDQVKCVYVDPPYNTGDDRFAYKDNYQHSSWVCMIHNLIELARRLLADTAGIATSISDTEKARLSLVSDDVFGQENHVSTLIWNTEGHTDNQYEIKENHEYIDLYARDRKSLQVGWVVDPNTRKESNLWKGFAENSITKNGPGNPHSEVTLPIGFPVEVDALDLTPNVPPKEFFDIVERRGHITREETQKYGVSYPIRLDAMRAAGARLTAPCRLVSGWANVNKLKDFIDGGCKPLSTSGETLHFYVSGLGVVYYRKEREKARNIYSVLQGMGTTEQMRSTIEAMGVRVPPKLYPKPLQLVSYLLRVLGVDEGTALDYFAGSGTTGHAVISLNREDGGRRRFILVEMGEYFDSVLLPRLQKVAFSKEWIGGKPKLPAEGTEAARSPRVIKILRLESYEDACDNIFLDRTNKQQEAFDELPDPEREKYRLHYMLDVESRGNASLLNLAKFSRPFEYTLRVTRDDITRDQTVDLVETFNWLLGIRVGTIRLSKDKSFKESDHGILEVTGTDPEGNRCLILWRNTDEVNDEKLLKWFEANRYKVKDFEWDLIYVNGDNTLENLKREDQTWTVRLTEQEFHRLMFEGTE